MDYLIERDDEHVTAWSAGRLAFEPKGWQVAYRRELRDALSSLADIGGMLVAELGTDSTEFFDVENVLLYNVGASAFRHLAARGVAFRRTTRPPPPSHFGSTAAMRTTYRVGLKPPWLADAPVASSFKLDLPRLTSDTKPHTVWWATTCSHRHREPRGGEFGLSLRVTTGARRQLNATSIIKPLLDGVISALQSGPSPNAEAVQRLAASLGQSQDAVAARLAEPGAVHGPPPLVKPFRTGVQWNPVDDRCTSVVLELARGGVAGWHVDGTLHLLS